ncbi:uncharacterized protein LOC110030247 [Phalaenopsis equestris]|uniref:uncharacterized protein LOC110030247 n=1 Tax=Phalaenopsis equestris TaxID=78828 RepID=UPI0009E63303|nr:uncharacterized protein LOC110030247 [Phalaenopsis equestris]
MELFRTPTEDFLVSSAAGSMWPWLAVLTAAVGLWRIRAVGSKYETRSPISPSPQPPPITAPFEKASVFTNVFGISPDAEVEERKSFAISECSEKFGSATGHLKELRRREPKELMARTVEEIPTTKERFTMVFSLDSAEDSCDCGGIECDETPEEEEELVGGGDADGEVVAPFERSEWMGLWGRKRSDFGWYRYLDRTAINGSVVRLWRGGVCRGRMGI